MEMRRGLDRCGDRALYKQVADLLRAAIESGVYAPGQRIPAVNDLVQEYEISHDSARKAMEMLAYEGLITIDRGGSHVREQADLTVVRVEHGEIRARSPAEPERMKYGIEKGVALLVVVRDGREEEIHPADSVGIEVPPRGRDRGGSEAESYVRAYPHTSGRMWQRSVSRMSIDPTADRALYKQLADLIRAQIERGELAPGQRIPAEKSYVEQHGISRDSVRRAIAVLRNEGFIVTSLRGSHVRSRADLTSVRVDQGTISARMPTEHERRERGIDEGIPVLVVEKAGKKPEVHAADRTIIEVDRD